MRIGQKLILGFVSIALLVEVVGYISVKTSQKTLQKTIGKNTVTLAVEVLDKIDRDIHNNIEIWRSYYVTNPRLKEAASASNQEFEKLDDIQEYINQKDQEWISVPKGELTPFMEEIIDNELSQRLRKKVDFSEKEQGYAVFPKAYVTNKHGVVIASTGRTSDYLQADEQWYQEAIAEEEFWFGEVEYDESSDSFASDIVINLYDESGNFAGIFKVILNVEEVINIIKEIKPGGEREAPGHKEHKTMQFKLVTKDGKVIYSTEDFEFFEDVSHKLLFRFHQEKHSDYFIAEGDKPGEGDELFAYAHSRGYGNYKGLGWILLIEHETKEIFAPVAQLRNRLVIISLGVAMLAILIGLFISRAISNPLTKLRDAAVEIGEGNLDVQIEVKSNDEIGELAASFQQMTVDLKRTTTSVDNLHREIIERKRAEEKLRSNMKDLERFNQLAVGRELQMIELKREVNALLGKLDREGKYSAGNVDNASGRSREEYL